MVDGNPYFPRASMAADLFRESDLTTVCGWKGTARYWDVVVGDQVISNVFWAYDTPKPYGETIRERLAICRGKGVELRCSVLHTVMPVSYTHLTLPTIYSV